MKAMTLPVRALPTAAIVVAGSPRASNVTRKRTSTLAAQQLKLASAFRFGPALE